VVSSHALGTSNLHSHSSLLPFTSMQRSRAKDDGSAWMMNCPFGFVALGDVWTKGYDEPEVDNYMCVNKNCAESCPYREFPAIVWSDKGSGVSSNCTCITNATQDWQTAFLCGCNN
jgi:hypothetical protein